MNDIKYKNENFNFAYRVSAIIYNADETKILLFYGNDMDFYMLPGGKVKEQEKSEDAIKREIFEELGYENLEFNFAGVSEELIAEKDTYIQEITLTYKCKYNGEIMDNSFKSKESDWINFKWVEISELNEYNIHPSKISLLVNNNCNQIVVEKNFSQNKLYLKQPNIDDLHYRQKWMQDYKTMEYNAGYDLELNGYDKATGIISKTNEEMQTWYDNWINKEPNKYFAYIYTNNIKEPVGEVYYYLDNGKYNMGILIQNKYRGKGFSKNSLELLCEVAKQNGIKELYDTFESDRMNVIRIFKNLGFKVVSKEFVKKFDKDVETITMKIEL